MFVFCCCCCCFPNICALIKLKKKNPSCKHHSKRAVRRSLTISRYTSVCNTSSVQRSRCRNWPLLLRPQNASNVRRDRIKLRGEPGGSFWRLFVPQALVGSSTVKHHLCIADYILRHLIKQVQASLRCAHGILLFFGSSQWLWQLSVPMISESAARRANPCLSRTHKSNTRAGKPHGQDCYHGRRDIVNIFDKNVSC